MRRWWGRPPGELSRMRLQLSSAPSRLRRLVGCSALLAAALAGAAASSAYWAARFDRLQLQALPAPQAQALRLDLEQRSQLLQLTQARAGELERQIDALNQTQRSCQEALTFFRKGRIGRSSAERGTSGE